MRTGRFTFTSESVSEGHPDKICDQISDAVLDAHLAGDPNSRVACESLVTTNLIVVAGEITSSRTVDYEKIARGVVRDIGYSGQDVDGFDSENCEVMVRVGKQSPDISQGVTVGEGLHEEQGAGDQGLMFGYACDQTPERMPLPISLAHHIVQRLAEFRKAGKMPYLRPDAKSQVSVEYVDGKPHRISTIVVSTQHTKDAIDERIREDVIKTIVAPILPPDLASDDLTYHVNPTGRFVVGGPQGDCGLTGRKIIVDTYGGWGRHGGGAFSGKDPSKVDRSAAYMARYLAKNVVEARLASECEVQIAYAIGVARPVSVLVNTFGSARDDETLADKLQEVVDLRPASIIEHFQLKRPIYRATAAYGHFGREPKDGLFPWEKTDLAARLA